MKKIIAFYIFALFLGMLVPSVAGAQMGTGCAAGFNCARQGVGVPGSSCSFTQWQNALVGQESGGSYTISAPNSSAIGRYQFINSTRASIGAAAGLPCASGTGSAAGFLSCPGLQDAYAMALWQQDYNTLQNAVGSIANAQPPVVHNGVPVTMSGLLAMAHNVGAQCAILWARGGQANMYANGPTFNGVPPGTPPCTDANGTNPITHYAGPMGGYSVFGSGGGSTCGFTAVAPNPQHFLNSGLLGCDPAVLNDTIPIVDALQQQEFEAAKALITQPTPVEQLTCADQHTEVMSAIGGTHSNPGGNISGTIGPMVQQPLQQTMQQFLNGNLAGSISSIVNNVYSSLTGAFNNALSSITSGLSGITSSLSNLGIGSPGPTAVPTNCTMMEDAWLISQCIQMPTLPSIANILQGQINNIIGNITAIPQRMLQQVCQNMNSKLGSYMANINGAFNNAAQAITQPIVNFTTVNVP